MFVQVGIDTRSPVAYSGAFVAGLDIWRGVILRSKELDRIRRFEFVVVMESELPLSDS